MGMGFQPKNLEPKHLVALSDLDVVELLESMIEKRTGREEYSTAGGPELASMLESLPDLYEGGEGPEHLTERGKQALKRMVAGADLGPLSVLHRPGATTELIDELNAALREHEIANAHFTISLFEGHPGPERNAAVTRRRVAEDRLTDAAMAYGRSVLKFLRERRLEALAKEDAEWEARNAQ